MKASDIKTVAEGLRDARPGEYPRGGPDTDDGWRMWHACEHALSMALATVSRNWDRASWEKWSGQC